MSSLIQSKHTLFKTPPENQRMYFMEELFIVTTHKMNLN
ncbi:hypothetical protein CL6EHI_097060 [Entamoeba histolytica]|uniref:Uncharacterized protein n=1 Tax=Entamoeba histolytica TaxID=5759 RepID=A0A175K180_ENTHI|nr:hypothetical protein CL6EHI_097060 [Entamoeba histolytica]